jgi:membrane protease subunit HflK
MPVSLGTTVAYQRSSAFPFCHRMSIEPNVVALSRRASLLPAVCLSGINCAVWLVIFASAPGAITGAVLAWSAWGFGVAVHASRDARERRPSQSGEAGMLRALRPVAALAHRAVLCLAAAGALAIAGWSAHQMASGSGALPGEAWWMPILLLCGFAGFFVQTLIDLRHRQCPRPDHRWAVVGSSLRMIALGYLVLAILVFAEGYFVVKATLLWAVVAPIVLGVWIGETVVRAVARMFQPPRLCRNFLPLGSSVLLRWFASPQDRGAWAARASGERPMIQLSEMWFLPVLRGMMLPVAAGAGTLAWLSTALHEVPCGSVGLLAKFGELHAKPLEAGLHVTLPFPFHEVIPIQRDALREVILGMEADTGAPILWDRAHYVGEESQLVGEGEDLLTISVPVYFRIKAPLEYFRGMADVDRVVRDVASRELLAQTLHRSAFEIMAPGRDDLAARLLDAIQSRLDAYGAGIEIVKVCLRDIHPPVEVASSYQEVVSAIEDREAAQHVGETYRAESMPRAKSDAAKLASQADTHHETRMAEVQGRTASFLRLLDSYQTGPAAFRIRHDYAIRDEALRGCKKLIIDEAYRDQFPTVVDLRKTLNPDFAPPPVQENALLIPSLRDRVNEFDRAIEGYLQMGRGAIPAPDFTPPDADNLLDKKP